MNITLLQLNPLVGDPEANLRAILAAVRQSPPTDLFVTPELALIGYPPRDLLSQSDLLARELRALEDLRRESEELGFSILVGHTGPSRRRPNPLHNQASLLSQGKNLGTVSKVRHPSYDIFDEERFFQAGDPAENRLFELHGKKFLVVICEDSWSSIAAFGPRDVRNYAETSSPMGSVALADFIVNLSASPFGISKQERREDLFSALAARYGKPVLYCTSVGAQDSVLFDGNSFAVAADGEVLPSGAAFEEALVNVRIGDDGLAVSKKILSSTNNSLPFAYENSGWGRLCFSLAMGIRDYARKTGHRQVLLGLSGGIDSALVATLARLALGPENVLGVSLPAELTSDLSRNEAREIARRLGIEFREFPVQGAVDAVQASLKLARQGLPYENLQSRARALHLMAIANAENRLLLATGNKSELAMGYSTLYGDLCGGLLVIGDLYKTEIYGLSFWINHRIRQAGGEEWIPTASLLRPPTAELAPGQKDSDSLPAYEILDPILESLIENQGELGRTEKGFAALLGERGLTLAGLRRKMALNEFKRYQAPPVLKVHARSFGRGWAMPLAKGIPPA